MIFSLAVITPITINYSRPIFFLNEFLIWNRELGLDLDVKITFSLQYDKSLSIVCLSVVLKSHEILPKYGQTKVSSL